MAKFSYTPDKDSFSLISQQLSSPQRGSFYYRLDMIKQNFYDISRFTEWPRFKSLENLIANNRTELERIHDLLTEVEGIR